MRQTEAPFDLVELKLVIPQAHPGTVAKASVIADLRASLCPFVTVVAPPGYGKTTLLSSWAEADPRPFAWVALDGRDDDAVVFLRYVASAIHRLEPVLPAVFEALSGPGESDWLKRVPPLGKALSQVERPFVLVLDDLHALANPSCLDALAALFEYVPPGSQIAIASRATPELPIARWRAQGLVHEVRDSDLRLDEREAELLLQAAGVTPSQDELSELAARSEGWPAGLYLAALSLQAGAPGPAGAMGFTGDDRFLSEYFRLELMSRMPKADAQFLKHTSILYRMCGELCDSVLETTRSGDMLETLERANCFIVPLDRRGKWYRYHHLFAELLRNELERTEPHEVLALNRRAMAWCIDNDLTEGAVHYSHAACETDTTARLVDALALPLYYDGRIETLERFLGWFSDDDLEQYPALAVYGAWIRALTGRPADAEQWLALAEGSTSSVELSDGTATISPWIANLRACMMRNGVEEAVADADLALDQLSPRSVWRPTAFVIRGAAHLLLGDTDRATIDLEAAIETGLAAGAGEVVFVAQAELALIAADEGAWSAAGQQARAAGALVEETGLSDYSTSALVHAATARIALHENRQEDARKALTLAHRLRPMLDHGIPWLSIQVGLELTRAHLLLADAGAARTVFAEAKRVLELRPHLGSLVGDAQELEDRLAATSGPDGAWAMSLTGAELRLLPYLATHLTFPAIAGRLFISRNTVKTEAVAIYRKLGASSRGEAVERAVEVGLMESSIYPPRANLTQEG